MRPPSCRVSIAEKGIYPAVDPLDSTSRMLDPRVIGEEHYQVARRVQVILQRYKALQDIIAILAWTNSPRGQAHRSQGAQDRALPVAALRRRAAVFTGSPGVQVKLEDTIKGFNGLCEGKYDHLPEPAFYMVGTIEEAVAKAERMAAEAA